jgi:hypothetical protein
MQAAVLPLQLEGRSCLRLPTLTTATPSQNASNAPSPDRARRLLNTAPMIAMRHDPPPRTIIARRTAGPRLAAENVRSCEWQSFPRGEPRRARERFERFESTLARSGITPKRLKQQPAGNEPDELR